MITLSTLFPVWAALMPHFRQTVQTSQTSRPVFLSLLRLKNRRPGELGGLITQGSVHLEMVLIPRLFYNKGDSICSQIVPLFFKTRENNVACHLRDNTSVLLTAAEAVAGGTISQLDIMKPGQLSSELSFSSCQLTVLHRTLSVPVSSRMSSSYSKAQCVP